MKPAAHYRCPLCFERLVTVTGGFVCSNNHCFDRAKEGYVNLLPVQHKGSKDPGDNQQMVLARRAFLAAGHYEALRNEVVTMAFTHMTRQGIDSGIVIDCGCGEGYYTNALGTELPAMEVYGIDIAKTAIKYAARRSDSVHFAVASTNSLPFTDAFADIMCKIFAPVDYQQIHRVLKPAGVLLSVSPGPEHLFELKRQIYQTPKQHEPEAVPKGFTVIDEKSLTKQVTLQGEQDIEALLSMTPFAWKINQQKKVELLSQSQLDLTFDFNLKLYQKSE